MPAKDQAQIPPNDPEAEEAVLSVVLLRGRDALDDVEGLLAPEDMYSEANRRVLEAARGVRDDGTAPDLVTVASWLQSRDRLKQIGGKSKLVDLLNAAPAVDTERLRAYARRVRELSAIRKLIASCHVTIAQSYANAAPPRELLEQHQRTVFDLGSMRDEKPYRRLGEVVKGVYEDFLARRAKGADVILGVPTGLRDFDAMLSGFRSGKLYIIAARPGMGKSALVMRPMLAAAEWGHGSILFSIEMPDVEVGERMICSDASVGLSAALNAQFSDRVWSNIAATCTKLSGLPILIDESVGITVDEMRAKVRRAKAELAREGVTLRLVVVDYLQLMRGRPGVQSREEALSEITRALKGMCKEFEVAVVALSQLNRKVEERSDKRPMLSDLRESGALEQDADVVTFIYRDGYYNRDCKTPNIAELIIAKQRGGEQGIVVVGWQSWRTTFVDREVVEQGGKAA